MYIQMKGTKYNYEFTKPNDEKITKENLNMNELCSEIHNNFNDNYFIDMKINRNIIYNIMSRPNTCNKIIRSKLKVNKNIL